MKTFPNIVLTLLAILLATPALSQPQTPGPLKPQQVKRFLDALAELEAWGVQNDRIVERVEIPDAADDLTSAYSAMIAGFRAQEMADAVTRILKLHGFSDLESWADTASRTMQAFAALKYDESASERAAGMKKALKEIEDSPMDEAQKEAMRKLLDSSDEVMQAFSDVSEADKRAVAPFMDRIQNKGAGEDDAQ